MRADEKGLGLIPVLIILLVVFTVAAASTATLYVLRGKTIAPEQTAKYLPPDAQIYLSLNLHPGTGQLGKAQGLWERFSQHPGFQPKLDNWMDDIESETGFDFKRDVEPWLGPEIGIGVIDVVGSVVAGEMGGIPIVIALLEITDPARSREFLEDWISFLEDEGNDYESETYQGATVFRDDSAFAYFAAAGDYLKFASDSDLLEETIDRIQGGGDGESLYSNPKFQTVRESLPKERFLTSYVDVKAIWTDSKRQFGSQIPEALRSQVDELGLDWFALTGSLLELGVQVDVISPVKTVERMPPPATTSLSSAHLVPADSIAYGAFKISTDLDLLRERLAVQSVADQEPDVQSVLTFMVDPNINEEDSLSDVFDILLDRFEEIAGFDFERDLLDWMSGEFSFVLLQSDFEGASEQPPTAAVRAAVLVKFDKGKRDSVENVLTTISGRLEDQMGITAASTVHGAGIGVVYEASQILGNDVYRPGYLILDGQLIIATDTGVFKEVALVEANERPSLADDPEYSRIASRFSGLPEMLFYLNISELEQAAVAAMDAKEFSQYKAEAEPFVEPLRSAFITSMIDDGVRRVSLVVTAE